MTSDKHQSRMDQLETMVPGFVTVLMMSAAFVLVRGLGYDVVEALGAMGLVWVSNLAHGVAHVFVDSTEEIA